ncbi:trigger factor [Candidatus Saccharibacteria bacterium CG10_big_fil_rev_8_21_14_0_10_47_8]|nr:MAG: trigger factor [Candidatus Saccharibacteria bacterium CG10_big_fil_rev_8_21_14_0_10_47_8]
MQVTKTIKSPTELTLYVSANAPELEPIKGHVLSHFAKNVKVPGFRAGKAPMNMVEKHVNQQAMLDEFIEHALNELYGRALDEQKLHPVAQPKVELKKFVPYTSLEFEAQIETIGEVKLPDYKKIKIAKTPVSVSAKDVNNVIDSLKQRAAQRNQVDRAAKSGDEVLIDFFGRDSKDQPVNGSEGKDYPLILGSNAFIPGFEDYLLGAKAGDNKEFGITFPGDYSVKALQGKKVTFTVDVKRVSEIVDPTVDDEFAGKIGPFKTVAELKADIKKQLGVEKQTQAERDYENELVKKITDSSSVQIPDVLIEQQITSLEEEEKRNLAYRGQTWQEHLKEEGLTEAEHRNRHQGEAEQRVKAGLVLSEISEIEKIDVTPQELEIRLQLLKSQHQDPAMLEELNNPDNRRNIAARLLTEKTIVKLVEYASKG